MAKKTFWQILVKKKSEKISLAFTSAKKTIISDAHQRAQMLVKKQIIGVHWRQKDNYRFYAHQRAHVWRDVTKSASPKLFHHATYVSKKKISPSTRVAWLTKEKNQKRKYQNHKKNYNFSVHNA